MVVIAYYSWTNNIRNFLNWHMPDDYTIKNIMEWESNEPFVLFTPTYNNGQVPEEVEDWMEVNDHFIRGVVGSGNRNFGSKLYAKAADKLSKRYEVPLIHKFEVSGQREDAIIICDRIEKLI